MLSPCVVQSAQQPRRGAVALVAAAVLALSAAGCDCYGTKPPDDGLDGGDDATLGDASDPDAAAPCYSGPPETRGVGQCWDGERVCVDGECAGCLGESLPGVEICNMLDDDCDGDTDEDIPPVCGDPCHCVDAGGTAGFDLPSAVAEAVEVAEDGSLVLADGIVSGTWQAQFSAYEACHCNAFIQVHPEAELPEGSSIVIEARQWEASEASPGDWETVGIYPGGPTVEQMSMVGPAAFCRAFYTEVRFVLRAAPDGASPRLTCFWLEPLCWMC